MGLNRFDALWADFLEGDLTAEGLAELDGLLASDPARLAVAAALYEQHRLLGALLGRFDEDGFVAGVREEIGGDEAAFADAVAARLPSPLPTPISPPTPAVSPVGFAAARPVRAALLSAALVLGLVAAGLWAWGPGRGPAAVAGPVPAASSFATVLRGVGCEAGGTTLRPGDRVPDGTLSLAAGVAAVRLDGGAAVILDARGGPVRLAVDSPAAATLSRGAVTVRADAEAAGFVLHTPAGPVIDLGTEFAVTTTPAGATEVHVTEGAVELPGGGDAGGGGEQEPRVLTAGGAVRLSRAGGRTRTDAVPLAAERFADLLKQTPARRERPGRLVAADGFSYPAGRASGRDRGAGGGLGWAGPWGVDWPTSPRTLAILPDGLTGPSGFGGARGGRVLIPPPDLGGGHALKRRLARPVDATHRRTLCLALLARRGAGDAGGDAGDEKSHAGGGFRLHFAGPPVNTGTGDGAVRPAGGRAGFGVLSDGRPIVLGPGGNTAGGGPVGDGTHLFLYRLELRSGRPDRGKLLVVRPGEDVPADDLAGGLAEWTVVGRPGTFGPVFDRLHLADGRRGRSGDAHDAGGWTFDELRLGTSWASVLGDPTTATDPDMTLETR